MREWYSASELASFALPAVPGSKYGVSKKAAKADWRSREAKFVGGTGREYHISSLPEAARIELARRAASDGAAAANDNPAGPALADPVTVLSETARGRADARLAVVSAYRSFRVASALSVTAARQSFSGLYNRSQIHVEGWVRDAVPSVSARSLATWEAKAESAGHARLAGKYGHRKGTGTIDSCDELRSFCIAQITARPHLTAQTLTEGIEQAIGQAIPRRTVQRWMKSWRADNGGLLQAVADPDKWRSHRKPAFGSRSEHITWLNELWEMDTTPADVMLLDGRHSVVGVVDVWSRRAMALVTKTPKSVANTSLLRRAMLAWGVPDVLKTDNGSDYKSRHMLRAMCDLRIRQDFCTPFKPEEKPHVERFFGTMTRALFEVLPGYIGHDVADRKAIEARRGFAERLGQPVEDLIAISLTADELQTKINEWIDAVYMHQTHAGLAGHTPFERAAESREAVRMPQDARALDVLLQEAPDTEGVRVIGKKGISVKRRYYIAATLGPLVGERVHVRIDPEDAGRIVCYDMDGRFLCVAEDPELTGSDRREIAIAAGVAAAAQKSKDRKEARALHKEHKPEELMDVIIAGRLEDQKALLGLPQQHVHYETPAMAAAREAAAALDGEADIPVPITDAERELAAEAMAAMERDQPAVPLTSQHDAGDNVVRIDPAGDERSQITDDFGYVRWALPIIDRLNATDLLTLDNILTAPGMDLVFEADAVAAARERQIERTARALSGA